MKAKNKKIIYYTDPVNDEFAENITKKIQIKDDFKYIKKNIFFRFFAFILYHGIALPIFFFILKIKYHVKVIDKKNIKPLLKTGFFIVGNHTQNIVDAIWPQTLLVPSKNAKIIAHNDVYSLKPLTTIIDMLGCIPTPNNMIQSKNFMDAIEYYIKKKNVIVIFPEAHIWPYYNDIRPFLDSSFIFPAKFNKPIICATVVYRQRKVFKNKSPYFSIIVSKPIFPLPNFSIKENQIYLRNEAYKNMKKAVKDYKSYEWIKYIQKK